LKQSPYLRIVSLGLGGVVCTAAEITVAVYTQPPCARELSGVWQSKRGHTLRAGGGVLAMLRRVCMRR